ncbi:MAG: hypothetical protein IJS26_01755 [Alphaproteobacteria bacterium]|nr:hypothetical protein [Alphaproteobacteria bacterium]
MFEKKNTEKLDPMSALFARHKTKLDKIMDFDLFEIVDLNGLKVLKYPEFEPYQKVIDSLCVIDNNRQTMPHQTQNLKENIVSCCRRQAFLEMLYDKREPTKERFLNLVQEKLLLCLVNLVLKPKLPLNQTLSREQISLAENTFKSMLKNA